jgi:hypothetical protein
LIPPFEIPGNRVAGAARQIPENLKEKHREQNDKRPNSRQGSS